MITCKRINSLQPNELDSTLLMREMYFFSPRKVSRFSGCFFWLLGILFIGNHLQASLGVQEDDQLSQEYISELVSQEILSQLDNQAAQLPQREQCSVSEDELSKKHRGYLYIQPYLPFYALNFQATDFVQLLFSFQAASRAFSGNGHSQDLSKLVFGDQQITVKEILLSSKLVKLGKLGSVGALASGGAVPGDAANVTSTQANHFLGILADQPVVFDASFEECVGAINYARCFEQIGLTVGFHVPLKIRHHSLRLVNDILPENTVKLKNIAAGKSADGTINIPGLTNQKTLQFYERYSDFNGFITGLLDAKGMSFNKKQTIAGFADVTAYVNFQLPSRYVDCWTAGLSLQFPTASERNVAKLWPTDLGNGGFCELAGYTTFMWRATRLINPYLHIKGTYGCPASVYRRVSMINTYDGKVFNGDVSLEGTPLPDTLPLDEELVFGLAGIPGGNKFSEPDSTVRQFADHAIKLKINPGPQLFCRVGNTIDAFFSPKSFLDLYYDLNLKGEDHIKKRGSNQGYVTGLLEHNTSIIAHTLGINYNYQFSAHYRLRLGTSYLFAGHNVPQSFFLDCALNTEF